MHNGRFFVVAVVVAGHFSPSPLDLMLGQEHVGNTITNHVNVLTIWADHLSRSDMGLNECKNKGVSIS